MPNNEETFTCHYCDDDYPLEDHHLFGEHDSCEECMDSRFICDRCGEVYHNGNRYTNNHNDEEFCTSCYDEIFTSCAECGREIYTHDSFCDEGGDYYCSEHVPDDEDDEADYDDDDSPNIPETEYDEPSDDSGQAPPPINVSSDRRDSSLRDYGYKPNPTYCRTDKEVHNEQTSPLYLGVELEVERNGSPLAINGAMGRVEKGSMIKLNQHPILYCKYDGSLRSGMEIVSMPFTWKWYKLNRCIYTQVFKLAKIGYRSFQTETCGMHVHLSKDCFGNIQIYKFLSLFYDACNRDFIIKISCRGTRTIRGEDQTALERWAGTSEQENRKSIAMNKLSFGTNRHTAVNMANHKTVEVRIFRGTLNKEGFERNLEFCVAAYEWTNTSSKFCDKGGRANYKDFIRYVSLCRQQYPNLFNWCKKHYESITGA